MTLSLFEAGGKIRPPRDLPWQAYHALQQTASEWLLWTGAGWAAVVTIGRETTNSNGHHDGLRKMDGL